MGEQPLKAKACCNLGSINLYEFVENKFTSQATFNFEDFEQTIKIASDALDDIIDENALRLPEELKQYRENAHNWRNIGLGVFNYADMLMALGLKYGSDEALDFTGDLFGFMMRKAIEYNNERGKIKGVYPKFHAEKIADSRMYKAYVPDFNKEKPTFRNCTLLSIAPTGSMGSV